MQFRPARLFWVIGATLCAVALTATAASGANPEKAPSLAAPAPAGAAAALAAPIALTKGETLFVPIPQCRIVNTQLAGAGGPIPANSVRNFYVRGSAGFVGQGGASAGCGIPTGALAISANVSTVSAGSNGYLLGYPANIGAPAGRFHNYKVGQIDTSNPTLYLSKVDYSPHLAIRTVGGSVHVVIDVVGYYVTQIHATVSPAGALYAASPRVLASTKLSTGSYRVTLDRDVSSCTAIAGINGGPYFASAYVSGNTVYAGTYNAAGTLTDLYWTLIVSC